jgi:hypothetical protein
MQKPAEATQKRRNASADGGADQDVLDQRLHQLPLYRRLHSAGIAMPDLPFPELLAMQVQFLKDQNA